MRVLVAGATGAIGKRLIPLLLNAGHEVFGTTRSAAKANALNAAAVSPIVVDVFDAPALCRAVASARPEIVIHELTDLPRGLDPSQMSAATLRNARIRGEGTRNLVAAALKARVRRLIAQSIAWAYASGSVPYSEDRALDVHAGGARGITVEGVVRLERLTLTSPPLEGVVLRHGHLYGPGTGTDAATITPSLHVDAAALAALLAIERAQPGIYNIADRGNMVSIEKSRGQLGWDPAFRFEDLPLTRERWVSAISSPVGEP